MEQKYIQDEVTEQKLEKLQETVGKMYNDLTVIYSNLLRKHRITEERLEAIETLLTTLCSYLDKVTPSISVQNTLVVGNQYVGELSFVGRDKEIVEYENRKFYQYSVKLKDIEGIYRMMVQTKYEVKEGFKITFLLAEDNNLRKVKIYE